MKNKIVLLLLITLLFIPKVYAVCDEGSYKVTYDANGGTPTETYNMYQGENYKKFYTPKRKGYKFLGWYTKETDGELVDSTTLVRKTKDHTLYAHWKKITYTINYELNGGTNNENNKSKYSVTTKTFALSNPTKKGYTFKGRYKDSEFKKSITSIKKGTTGNITLYAKWVSSDTIEKNNFINDAKAIYHIAQNKWIEDSILEVGDKSYSDLAGAPGGYTYSITINNEGNVINYYVSNGKYEYEYEGLGLSMDEIIAVAI